MNNKQNPPEDKSSPNESSFFDEFKLLLKKHFGSKISFNSQRLQLYKKYPSSLKNFLVKKKYSKFLIPAVVIGLIANANLGNKNKVAEAELVWPVSWSEFKKDWNKSKWMKDNIKYSGSRYMEKWRKNYPCQLRSARVWKIECEKVKEMRTVVFQKNIKDACVVWADSKSMANTYLNQLGENTAKYSSKRSLRWEDDKKYQLRHGNSKYGGNLRSDLFIQFRSPADERAYKKFVKSQDLLFPIYRYWRLRSFANYIEVLRQSGIKDWKMYSRWNPDGVKDLYLKNFSNDEAKARTKYYIYSWGGNKDVDDFVAVRNSAKEVCLPFVDFEEIEKIVVFNSFEPFYTD